MAGSVQWASKRQCLIVTGDPLIVFIGSEFGTSNGFDIVTV